MWNILSVLGTCMWMSCLHCELLFSSLQVTQPKTEDVHFLKAQRNERIRGCCAWPEMKFFSSLCLNKTLDSPALQAIHRKSVGTTGWFGKDFLRILLKIKLRKAQPQQAQSYTQPGTTICHRELYTLKKFLYMCLNKTLLFSSQKLI